VLKVCALFVADLSHGGRSEGRAEQHTALLSGRGGQACPCSSGSNRSLPSCWYRTCLSDAMHAPFTAVIVRSHASHGLRAQTT